MPNWVQNKFTVSGPAEQLQAFREGVRQLDETNGENSSFDFNRFIPMPKELSINSGSFGDIGYAAFHGDPAHVLSYPWVAGAGVKTREELQAFLDQKDPGYREQGALYAENIRKYGAPTWYEWCTTNWLTKWNANDADIRNLDETHLEVYFSTAWSWAEPIFEKMIAAFPQLEFEGRVDEEGGFFYLNFQGKEGVLTYDHFEGVREGGPYDYSDDELET